MIEPEDEYWMAWGPDDPDMWRASCDDEMASYPLETDIDGAGDRVSYDYRDFPWDALPVILLAACIVFLPLLDQS